MSDQTALFPTPPTLTDRQLHALVAIAHVEDGLPPDELGAIDHERRLHERGRGHDRDRRCDFCARDGMTLYRELHAKGLVVKRRRTRLIQLTKAGVELLPEPVAALAAARGGAGSGNSVGPSTNELPEGY